MNPPERFDARVWTARSPNFDARPAGARPDMVIIHYTGMISTAASLTRLCDPAAKVSAHWFIDEHGVAVALVDEAARAWHAGVSQWAGVSNCNHISIGIELQNPGHEWGYRPFPPAQIAALIALVGAIRTRWAIAPRRVIGHADVSPGRKEDPGELFPWATLAAAGHAVALSPPWPTDDDVVVVVAPQDQGPAAAAIQADLAALGYAAPQNGRADGATLAAAHAFRQRFYPRDRPWRSTGDRGGLTAFDLALAARAASAFPAAGGDAG